MADYVFYVTVSGSKFVIDSVSQQTVDLGHTITYQFDQSDSTNSGHPLKLSTTSDGTHNSGSEYTTGVTTAGTPGSSGAYTEIAVTSSTASTLYYYCSNHSGMGGQINTTASEYADTSGVALKKPILANATNKWGNYSNQNLDTIAGKLPQNFTFPTDAGTDGHVITSDGSGGASWQENSNLSLIDEDNMATDSATKVPSQQSVKAYADDFGYQGEPHIIPNMLYPAIEGKSNTGVDLKALVTAGSYTWGDVYSGDNLRYFYTDIKGSRKIHDPRVGSHFGSQRHKFKSLQLLEQETATHGNNVYSIDGREWMRAVDVSGNPAWKMDNAGNGTPLNSGTGSDCTGLYIEVTGYFNDFNIITILATNGCDDIDVTVNGTIAIDGSGTLGGNNTVASPLNSRFVDSGSVINAGLTSTLGINTIKFEAKTGSSEYLYLYGIELIAQDTSNRNNIQIPSQNVVSYGKKFTISGTPHYDPFNGFTNGTSLHSAFVDTATSLGLDSAPGSSAKWAISSTNHIRPYQGGRVVKWVDSDGTIKTSVNMMPPNAQNISTTADSEITTPSATNTNYKPAFSDDAIDHSQAEVAKLWHYREFGNGSGNGGTGGTYADASMLNTSDDIAFCMDDGLTSLSVKDATAPSNNLSASTHDMVGYLTFIGTGLSFLHSSGDWNHIVQNLPYGTHIAKFNWTNGGKKVIVDGVEVLDNNSQAIENEEFAFYQPKRPPIPEDAVILADYMLLADEVPRSSYVQNSYGKGERRVDGSRDHFFDQSAGTPSLFQSHTDSVNGFRIALSNDNGTKTVKIPFFGTGISVYQGQTSASSNAQTFSLSKNGGTSYALSDSNISSHFSGATRFDDFDGTFSTSGVLDQTDGSAGYDHVAGIKGLEVANYVLTLTTSSATHYVQFNGSATHTPIHTSHHYQSFETPYLHELIGGDRNMEQTNLIVSPDGRSWDEVTRDVSYLGPKYSLTCSHPNGGSTNGATSSTGSSGKLNSFFTDYRGEIDSANMHNKGIALAYDSFIILHDGYYEISVSMRGLNQTQLGLAIKVNDTDVKYHYALNNSSDNGGINFSDTYYMKKGERWDVRIVSGTFRIQFRAPNLFQVKYLGSGR